MKYVITNNSKVIETIDYNSITGVHKPVNKEVFQIRAVKTFRVGNHVVKCGDKGGFVEGFHNLSQKDNCWIHEDYVVSGPWMIVGDTIMGKPKTKSMKNIIFGGVVCAFALSLCSLSLYTNGVALSYSQTAVACIYSAVMFTIGVWVIVKKPFNI